MSKHETRARKLKSEGNNCSDAIYGAFSDDIELSEGYPQPRSIEGKCGALLTSLKILKDMGYEDRQEAFEKEFIKRFGYSKCIDLMTHERRCSDYVGESVEMIDKIIEEKQHCSSK